MPTTISEQAYRHLQHPVAGQAFYADGYRVGQFLAARLRESLGHGRSHVHHYPQPYHLSRPGRHLPAGHLGEVAALSVSDLPVPFYSRLRESGYNKTYMRMYDHVKPFLKLQLKYSILSARPSSR